MGTAAASGVAPAGASPETHRVVLEQIEAIRALKLRAADAEAAASAATREAAHSAATCRHAEEERDALMARLEKQVASTSARGGGVQTAGEESAVAQVTAVAQSTIARLQDLVADKNRALTRAQQAMTDLRADAVEKQAEDRATIEELNELLFKQNQREIANMREAVTFGVESSAVSGGAPSGSNKAESSAAARSKTRGGGRFADASRDDLIAMIDEKEVAVEALTMKYEQQRARHESAEARLQEAADLRVGEANRVVAQASRSAGASQSAKVLETLVSRLKTQLSSKEKRIAQLKDAVRELEKKLGDALTRSADVAARAAGTVSERAASRAGEENKNAVLAEKLRRAQDALARLEARERDWNEEKRALLQEKRAARRRESAGSPGRATGRRANPGSRAPPRGLAGGVASPDDADAHAAAALVVARERAEELENRVKAPPRATPSSTGCSAPSARLSGTRRRSKRAGPTLTRVRIARRWRTNPMRTTKTKPSRTPAPRHAARRRSRAGRRVSSCASARRRSQRSWRRRRASSRLLKSSSSAGATPSPTRPRRSTRSPRSSARPRTRSPARRRPRSRTRLTPRRRESCTSSARRCTASSPPRAAWWTSSKPARWRGCSGASTSSKPTLPPTRRVGRSGPRSRRASACSRRTYCLRRMPKSV